MAYIINKSDGSILLTLQDGTVDTSTSLGLLGRNYTGYGEIQNENFIFLLENFSNENPPGRPMSGQLWYDSTGKRINVYDGEVWSPVGSATTGELPPPEITGSFWMKKPTDQLFVFAGESWRLIGPEALPGFGTTKVEARVLRDIEENPHPVLLHVLNDQVLAITSPDEFTVLPEDAITNFFNITKGLTLAPEMVFTGNLVGNATTSTRFETARTINGVVFDAQTDITVKADTNNFLIKGSYLLGENFDGSVETTWAVDASSTNVIGTVVARDSEGSFSAGTINSSQFVGPLRGNVTIELGTSTFDRIVCNRIEGAEFTGNAFSASRLQVARNINGVSFNGTEDVTVPASATTLTGTRLASNVVESSLTTIGKLDSLAVKDSGVDVGTFSSFKFSITEGFPTIEENTGKGLSLIIKDESRLGTEKVVIKLITANDSVLIGSTPNPTILPDIDSSINLGAGSFRFSNIFSAKFTGNLEGIPTSPSIIKGGTNGIGDIGQSTNRFGNVFAVNFSGNFNGTPFVPTVIKTGIDGTGDIGQVNNRFENVYGITFHGDLIGSVSTPVITKTGTNATGDIGEEFNKFNNVWAVTFRGESTSAQYADLAENYAADRHYEAGTVLEFGGDHEVTIAADESRKVAGVVSENPAYLMNSNCSYQFVAPVALQGRVFCKVKGTVKKGDMLVSAGEGFAKSCDEPKIGMVIGKSLGNFDGDEGIVEVVVGRL
jgi:hypothetical protein